MGDMFRSATGVSPSTLLPRVDSDSRLLPFSGVTLGVALGVEASRLLLFSGVTLGVALGVALGVEATRLVGVAGGEPCLRV